MKETNKRQDETDSRVEDNCRNIDALRNLVEATRRELREQTAMSEGLAGRMQRIMEEELREREARRLNLVLHGVPEPGPNIKEMRERMEMDREKCEHIFVGMGARTRRHQIRFCRRVGERGQNPRPLVIGLYSEENRGHILERSRYLRNTRYEAVSVVPDLTQSQRRGEQRLREEAEGRNQELTNEDRERNLRWITLGSRGEKRLIKGTEREDQTRGGPGWRGGWMGGGRGEGRVPVRGLQANNRTRREELNGEADHTNSIDGGNGSAQGLRRNGQDGAGAGMQSGEGSSENGGGDRREELNEAASHSSGTTSTEGRGGVAQGPRNNAEGRGGITQGPRRSGQNEDRAGVRDEGVSLESRRREGNHDNGRGNGNGGLRREEQQFSNGTGYGYGYGNGNSYNNGYGNESDYGNRRNSNYNHNNSGYNDDARDNYGRQGGGRGNYEAGYRGGTQRERGRGNYNNGKGDAYPPATRNNGLDWCPMNSDRQWQETGAQRKEGNNYSENCQDRAMPRNMRSDMDEVEWESGNLPAPIGSRKRMNSKRRSSWEMEEEEEQNNRRQRL